MAKPMAPPSVVSADDPGTWSAGVLRLRFDEVISFAEAARVDGNINGVHDMRVALRRLRSAIRDFADLKDEKQIKQISRKLKEIAAALGAVRDHDVAIIALKSLAAQTDDDSIKMGIASLLEGHRLGREHAFARLKGSFSALSLAELRERFLGSVDGVLHQKGQYGPASLKDAASNVIGSRIRDLFDLGHAIYEPLASDKLHGLRIAAKRLRYAIELFGDCFPEEIRKFADELATLQSNLGEVHDCDLRIEDLSSRLTRKKAGDAVEVEIVAAAWIISKCIQKRAKEYRSALELWREWTASGFLNRLRTATT